MARPRRQKKGEPAVTKVLPMELHVGDRLDEAGESEVIGHPVTTAAGKNAHARVRTVGPARTHRPTELGRAQGDQRDSRDRRGGQAMMRLGRRASLLVAFFLLTSTATAYAECAWVFWLEVSGPPSHESSSRPVSGWSTREACEQALTQKLASDSEKDTSMDVTVDPQAGRPRLWLRRKGLPEPLAVYTYVCLTDTVDPRGVKAK